MLTYAFVELLFDVYYLYIESFFFLSSEREGRLLSLLLSNTLQDTFAHVSIIDNKRLLPDYLLKLLRVNQICASEVLTQCWTHNIIKCFRLRRSIQTSVDISKYTRYIIIHAYWLELNLHAFCKIHVPLSLYDLSEGEL